MGVLIWRQRAPQATFRQRVAGWRARNWRRAVLAWFVLSLIIMAVAAEPRTDFPKAQARSVPAVRMVLRVAGGLTAAGVPCCSSPCPEAGAAASQPAVAGAVPAR